MITHDAPGFSSRLRLANSPLPLAPPMRPPRAARGFRISGTTNSLCAAGGRGILSEPAEIADGEGARNQRSLLRFSTRHGLSWRHHLWHGCIRGIPDGVST